MKRRVSEIPGIKHMFDYRPCCRQATSPRSPVPWWTRTLGTRGWRVVAGVPHRLALWHHDQVGCLLRLAAAETASFLSSPSPPAQFPPSPSTPLERGVPCSPP